MVTINNGVRQTTVTLGVFKEVYEKDGWKIGNLSKDPEPAVTLPEVEENDAENLSEEPEMSFENVSLPDEVIEDDEEVEIPISEMKINELRTFAAEHGIDISKAKNKREVRDAIMQAMEG